MKQLYALLLLAFVGLTGYAQSDIVITEIMYNPPESGSDSLEYIEFHNKGNAAINLNNYTFSQGVTYTFPSITINAGGYLILAKDSAAMQNVFGITAREWAAGSLSNSGEDIILKDASGITVDSVDYDDNAPWPTDADGNGYSIVLCNVNADNSLAASWTLSGSSTGVTINNKAISASPTASDAACNTTPTLPTYPISTISTVDATTGVADSLNVECWTKGLVLGVDMRGGNGIQFTIFDNGEGMGVFNFSNVSNYSVTEGDSILIKGKVTQFNGLTQFTSIDSIHVVNTGNAIPTPQVVTTLDEATESELVRINNVKITAISSSNYTLTNANGTYTMRVDNDTDVDDSLSLAVGDSLCHVIGIGGQFDSSNPYTSGYQIFPRRYSDVDTTCTQGGGGNPNPTTLPTYPISTISTVDATTGVADSLNVECWTKGLVLGVDMRGGNGIQFTIFDNGEGMGVFNSSDVNNYTVAEGDSILIKGKVTQFNGLTQLTSIDSIHVVNTGNAIPAPQVVTALGEATESELVRINNVKIASVSGSNYTLTNANGTYTMRVDNDTDVDDSLSLAVGDSLCHVIGIGGQWDSSNPYTSGYQIFPRRYSDVDTTCTQGGGGNPNPTTLPTYPISVISTVDATTGVVDSANVECWTKGLVLGVDMRGGAGVQFTIFDNGEGIGVFSSSNVSNYTVTEGDSILIKGKVGQFNGLAQMGSIDSIHVVNTGNAIPTPPVVTTLGEATESELVRINNVKITAVNSSGSGTNYTLVNTNGTYTMRVDNDTDVDDSLSLAVGDSLCHVIGIGGQYDNSNPYTSGYQIFPRRYSDVDTTCTQGGGGNPNPTTVPTYPISVINNTDANGVADSNNVICWTKGMVLGVDMRGGNGIQFTIHDGEGMGVFNSSDVSNYTVTEGDSIMIKGKVSQFNGLTQLKDIDSIKVINSGNCLPFPKIVTQLSETTESDFIEFRGVKLADPTQWPAPGSSKNLKFITAAGDTLAMRIDSDTKIADSITTAPTGTFNLIGIGGQYDSSNPYTSGYQIFPRRKGDINTNTTIAAPAGLQINELLASNVSSVSDNANEKEDWIELYNSGNTTIDLTGFFMSDDAANPTMFRFPRCANKTKVNSKEFKLLWADNDLDQGAAHVGFKLSKNGEFVGLYTPDGKTVVDSVTFVALADDASYGLNNNEKSKGFKIFTGSKVTPAASNPNVTSVAEVTAQNNPLSAYPNPSQGGIINFNKVVNAKVFNVQGQHVATIVNNTMLNTDSFESGIYIIKTLEGEIVKLIKK